MGSRARLAKLVQDLRASYWFIPMVLVLCAIALAQGCLLIDRTSLFHTYLPSFAQTQAGGARAVLSVIAQAVIGVTGVMFSITMVAVSFASSNYGPRLIGNFMRDRGNQISLGILIATFVYALLILRAVQDPSAQDASVTIDLFVPHAALLMAMILALISVFTMIYFVHHVPETINVSNITASLGHRLLSDICALTQSDTDPRDLTGENGSGWYNEVDMDAAVGITLNQSGYVQTLNKARLRELAAEGGYKIALRAMPGDFIGPRDTVADVWGPDIDGDTCVAMQTCFAVGTARTEHQNLLFVVEELVEIIARALSPGVNDPFTAINCLNWLNVGLREFAVQGGTPIPDPNDLVHIPHLSFRRMLGVSYGRAIQYICTDDLSHAHALLLLDALHDQLPDGKRRDSVYDMAQRYRAKC